MTEDNSIYKNQLAVLVFILTFAFKMSRLPPEMAGVMGSSGTLVVCIYLLLELITFLFVYGFMKRGGLDAIDQNPSKIFKSLLVIVMVYYLAKTCLTTGGTILFVIELLFDGVSARLICVTLLIPIFYLAYKGMRTIARFSQICIWLFAFVLAFNYIFLKANPIFSQNLPLINDTIPKMFEKGSSFFLWFGDVTPLLFIKLKKPHEKGTAIAVALIAAFVLIIYGFLLLFALYGNAAPYINNFLVKVASYNQFADKLGRLDWSGIIIWLLMAMIYLAVYFWVIGEIGSRVFKKRNLVLSLSVIAVAIFEFMLKDYQRVGEFAMSEIKYCAAFCNYIFPAIVIIWAYALKKKNAKADALQGGASVGESV